MLPTIAIVGRPNVGKSLLFNRLTGSKDALVVDLPGTTRDRIYGEANIADQKYLLVDTGGISEEDDADSTFCKMSEQLWLAVEQSDAILFVVDGQAGLMDFDKNIANKLRCLNKPILLVVNKTDGCDPQAACFDFFALGLAKIVDISAKHKRGLLKLSTAIQEYFNLYNNLNNKLDNKKDLDTSTDNNININIKVAVVGQPNVGKSTLVNKLLGQERVIVLDQPGTTRDSIYIPFSSKGQAYTIVDTAGIRRKKKVKETVEKFSVVKTLHSIQSAHVVLFLLDANRGVLDKDLNILDFVVNTGRALVIAINKWDEISTEKRLQIKKSLGNRLQFVNFAQQYFVSALKGTGISKLLPAVKHAYYNSINPVASSKLTSILQSVVIKHEPPLVQGRRIRLRYAHIGGHNPPKIIIHGNQTCKIPASYSRYLIKSFREKLQFAGTPVWIMFKQNKNPYV